MHKLYGQVLAEHMIPHLLLCFDHIYEIEINNDIKHNEIDNKKMKLTSISIKKIIDAKDRLNSDVFNILNECWNILQKGSLIVTPIIIIKKPISLINNNQIKVLSVVSSEEDTIRENKDDTASTPDVVHNSTDKDKTN